MRILSGIQSSGKVHIGNYFGMIKQMVEYQTRGELFCFIANMHGLTSVFDGVQLRQNTVDLLIDLIALGIDPEKSILWIQSDIPEVTELTWYLNNVTPIALLERCHSYKDKVARNIPPSNGLFSYPVLMAADILLYDSDIVPVGKDQKQHVEITRDIAIKFNNIYGDVLRIPDVEIKEEVAVIPGVDGLKMSKSYDNTIEIFETEKTIRSKIMSLKTDSKGVNEPKDANDTLIYTYYKLFASHQMCVEMEDKFRSGGYGYAEAKKTLFAACMDFFHSARTKRDAISKDRAWVEDMRKKGAHKARHHAQQVLERVRNAVGMPQ